MYGTLPFSYQDLLHKFEFKYSVLEAEDFVSQREPVILEKTCTVADLLKYFNERLAGDRAEYEENFRKANKSPLAVGPYCCELYYDENSVKVDKILELDDPLAVDCQVERYIEDKEVIFIPTFIHERASNTQTCKISLSVNMNRHMVSLCYMLTVPTSLTTKELVELIIQFATSRRFLQYKRGNASSFKDIAKLSSYHVSLWTKKATSRKSMKVDLLNVKDSDINWLSYLEEGLEPKRCVITFDFILETDSSLKIKS